MELARISTSGSAQQHVLSAIMREVDLEGVTRLKCAEGLTRIWEDTPGNLHSCDDILEVRLRKPSIMSPPANTTSIP